MAPGGRPIPWKRHPYLRALIGVAISGFPATWGVGVIHTGAIWGEDMSGPPLTPTHLPLMFWRSVAIPFAFAIITGVCSIHLAIAFRRGSREAV
jgi:ABC-type Fe3+ transport system permease subunit